jgi:hypothetical protein
MLTVHGKGQLYRFLKKVNTNATRIYLTVKLFCDISTGAPQKQPAVIFFEKGFNLLVVSSR